MPTPSKPQPVLSTGAGVRRAGSTWERRPCQSHCPTRRPSTDTELHSTSPLTKHKQPGRGGHVPGHLAPRTCMLAPPGCVSTASPSPQSAQAPAAPPPSPPTPLSPPGPPPRLSAASHGPTPGSAAATGRGRRGFSRESDPGTPGDVQAARPNQQSGQRHGHWPRAGAATARAAASGQRDPGRGSPPRCASAAPSVTRGEVARGCARLPQTGRSAPRLAPGGRAATDFTPAAGALTGGRRPSAHGAWSSAGPPHRNGP